MCWRYHYADDRPAGFGSVLLLTARSVRDRYDYLWCGYKHYMCVHLARFLPCIVCLPATKRLQKNAYDSLAQAKQGGDSATLSKPTSCPDDLVPVNINALVSLLRMQFARS